MIDDELNKFMPESVEELPELAGAHTLYLDFETTSGEDKKNSKNPFINCDVLGICITVDEDPSAYYIPLRHRNPERNLDPEPVYKWLREIVRRAKRWINSFIKYDCHVYLNYIAEEGETLDHLELCCTVTQAKIIDSDRFTYGLKELAFEWLHDDISRFENANKIYTHTKKGSWKIHDYAVIPPYQMYLYGCQDVLSVRDLHKYIMELMPPECQETSEIENGLTSALVQVEQYGTYVDKLLVGKDAVKRIPNKLTAIEEELREITEEYFRPHVNRDCHKILCVKYQAPVLSWTKGSDTKEPEPSFDKDTLKIYETYSCIPDNVVSLIREYRHYHQLLGTFAKPYLFKSVNRRMHGSFNQSVRTGRMSMSDPNMQQTSPDAKRYIIPSPGYSLIQYDLKQIEYRYVVTYTENPDILKEYRSNPAADYHSMMAELCGIGRAPAKNMNFAVSFRAGKKKTISMLRAAFDPKEVPVGMDFEIYVQSRGNEVFETYHQRHPELRREWDNAERVCRRKGYCKNIFGRRRHIRGKGAYMAFPNIIQSSAADLMKRITIRLHNSLKDEAPRLICIVHDSWLFEVPLGTEDHWEPIIKSIIEETESRLAVPLYASVDRAANNWAECKD